MTGGRPRLRVAIDARVTPGAAGGIAQAALSLVRALGQLETDETEYLVVVQDQRGVDFIEPAIGPSQRLVLRGPEAVSFLTRATRRASRQLGRGSAAASGLPASDGFYEGLGVDVVHFPHQAFLPTALPSVYNPHDLQHLHYPQFFSEESLAWREAVYEPACRLATTVIVSSQWVKDDVVSNYGIEPGRVQIVPWGPPTSGYDRPSDDDCRAIVAGLGIVEPYVFYPAVPWPHKNHLALLEALVALRDDRGLVVRLACSGSLDADHWPVVRDAVDRLGLGSQVTFLGYVSDSELRALYVCAQAMVMATLFESDSFPIFEAWLDGVPVVCSDVTSLPDQVGDAGLVFPPTAEGIAAALARIATEPALRQQLSARGRERLADYSWERTARAYRAVYRRAAGHPLTEREELLLAWDWMRCKAPPPRTAG